MSRRGAALLEAVVALTILTTAGSALLGRLVSLGDAWQRMREHEEMMLGAERVMVATSLLSASDLSQRLGAREVGAFVVWVDRPEPKLFRVGVSSTAAPGEELLATLVHADPDEDM